MSLKGKCFKKKKNSTLLFKSKMPSPPLQMKFNRRRKPLKNYRKNWKKPEMLKLQKLRNNSRSLKLSSLRRKEELLQKQEIVLL